MSSLIFLLAMPMAIHGLMLNTGDHLEPTKPRFGPPENDSGVVIMPWVRACRQNGMISPLSDVDGQAGHGNKDCRYEPEPAENLKFKQSPEDIAILVPFRHQVGNEIPEEPELLNGQLHHAVAMWRNYARFHGYAFYTGPTNKEFMDENCPHVWQRAPHWTKPCAAMELIQKHKYILIADAGDTFVSKPRLRLEPLFEMAGLTDERNLKTIAVAREWGSCHNGNRAGGDSNTGIVLMKQHESSIAAINDWYNEPDTCDQNEVPQEGEKHSRCTRLVHSKANWPYDQLAFHISIAANPSHIDKVQMLKQGCPINSPWADFIPHLVSGTVSNEYYHWADRNKLIYSAYNCTKNILAKEGPIHERCALCDMIPQLPRNEWYRTSYIHACPKRLEERNWALQNMDTQDVEKKKAKSFRELEGQAHEDWPEILGPS